MTTLSERIDISASLRSVGMRQNMTLDLENSSVPTPFPTEGWIRQWDEEQSQYIWVNRDAHYSSAKNPFLFSSPNQIPVEIRNRWVSVMDEREHRVLYVNASLSREQWTQPLEQPKEDANKSHLFTKAHHFSEYAEKHFNLSRGWFRSRYPLKQALAFSEQRLEQPLLLMESDRTYQALLINKLIWSYTKNEPLIAHSEEYVQQIIALLLLSPPILIDECYCQTLKQMTSCNSQSIVDRSWGILIVLAASLLPSDELLPYVEDFVRNSNNTVSSSLPERCQRALTLCKKIGPRKEPPSREEIVCLIRDERMELSVHVLPDQEMQLEVTMMTQASDIVKQIGEVLELGEYVKSFQLYRARDMDEILIPERHRITDVLARMSDGDHLLFAMCYYYPYNIYNTAVLRLVYDQAVHDLHCGRYFHEDTDYFTLAAIALQERMQDYSGDNRVLCDAVDELLPPHLTTDSRRLVCEAEVLKIYNKLRGYAAQECIITLLEYMNSWEDYGVTHFVGEQINPERRERVIVGISPRGIHIGDYDNHVGTTAYTKHYTYKTISAWGLSPNSFSFYLATKPKQRHYQFVMQHTDAAYDLITHYYPFSVCFI